MRLRAFASALAAAAAFLASRQAAYTTGTILDVAGGRGRLMAPPLRVLHVNAGNLFGGVETFLVTLARCHDLCPDMVPEYAVCFPGRFRDELTAAGVPVRPV